jgi:transposase-like protein
MPVAEVCRKAGISQATFLNWKKKYSGMLPSEMQRLRELEAENVRLKKIVADLSLDSEAARGPDSGQRSAGNLGPWILFTINWRQAGRAGF